MIKEQEQLEPLGSYGDGIRRILQIFLISYKQKADFYS